LFELTFFIEAVELLGILLISIAFHEHGIQIPFSEVNSTMDSHRWPQNDIVWTGLCWWSDTNIIYRGTLLSISHDSLIPDWFGTTNSNFVYLLAWIFSSLLSQIVGIGDKQIKVPNLLIYHIDEFSWRDLIINFFIVINRKFDVVFSVTKLHVLIRIQAHHDCIINTFPVWKSGLFFFLLGGKCSFFLSYYLISID